MRIMLKAALLVAGLAAVITGCTQKQNTAGIEAMLRAHGTAWADAYNAGDADKIVASYADDASLLPPNSPAATGKDAMKQWLIQDMAQSKAAGLTLAIDNGTSGISGDVAWYSGNFHVNDTSGAATGTGKYLEVWHQDAKGNWSVTRDMWNYDAAPPPPAPAPCEPKAAPKKPAAHHTTHTSKKKK